MKRFLLSFAAASAVLVAIPVAANAQPWRSINERQANIEQRIDQGVRSGALTRAEAVTLRGEFNTLSRLEAEYRRSGGVLDARERADLDGRFDRLSQRVQVQKHDRDDRRGGAWQSINQRQANIEQRIDQGVRSGALTRAEAVTLRGEFNTLSRLEAEYRRSGGGLDARERADLDDRFDRLSRRVLVQKHDRDDRRGGAWQSINQRQANLDRRIDQGVRDRSLNRREASLLRAEFQRLVQVEAQYRRSGGVFTNAERADLDNRFDRLSQRIRSERNDRPNR